jgi:hypothetical protein
MTMPEASNYFKVIDLFTRGRDAYFRKRFVAAGLGSNKLKAWTQGLLLHT